MLGRHVDIAVVIDCVPVRGQRIVQARIDRNFVLPLRRNFKGLYYVNRFVELGIDKPLPVGKSAVLSRVEHRFIEGTFQKTRFLFRKIRVVRPGHKLVPYLFVIAAVEINFVIDKRFAFQRSHRSEYISAPVHNAQKTLLVYILGRFFVKPHEIERRALKFFPALIAAFEAQRRNSAEHVFNLYLIYHSRRRTVAPARKHNYFRYPALRQIFENFRLRDVALDLCRQRDRPAERIFSVFAVRMYSP